MTITSTTLSTIHVDSVFIYLNEAIIEVNQNYIIKLDSAMGFEWALQLGTAHSHANDNMNRVSSSSYFVFYLSADAIHVVDRSTGTVSASVPGKKFDTAYDPLCLTFYNNDIFIINRRISDDVILVSRVPADNPTAMTFDFTKTRSLDGLFAKYALFGYDANNYGILATGGGSHKARVSVFSYGTSITFLASYELGPSDKIGLPVSSEVNIIGYQDLSSNNYCLLEIDSSNFYYVSYYK